MGDGETKWRHDIDALAFRPEGHRGTCVVHRLAFRTLMRLVPRTRSSHHIAARAFANFGFKSGTRIIDLTGVPLIPRFASSVPQGRANLGIGTPVPTPDACIAYFIAHEDAFRASAQAKIGRRRLPPGANFHLTSRDLRALTVAK